MEPPLPCPTPTWHNDVYPAIDPTNSELSQKGKTVIITGAGSGIGRETAIAFSKAGANRIVLIGRTESTLLETRGLATNHRTRITVAPCDVTDMEGMQAIAGTVGQWDILILNAAYNSGPAAISSIVLGEFWMNYEVNVKSIIIAVQAFFPTAIPTAAVYGVTSNALCLPTSLTLGLSAYISSKIALAKLMEYLAAENPAMFICSLHPGMVDTKIFRASGATPDMLPIDMPQLPAHFMVWLSQPKARFLNGRFIWANWDVNELLSQADKIIGSSTYLTIGCQGWPFAFGNDRGLQEPATAS